MEKNSTEKRPIVKRAAFSRHPAKDFKAMISQNNAAAV